MTLYAPHTVALPSLRDERYVLAVMSVAEARRQLAPWTLVQLPSEPAPLIATRRTWWMRAVTWCLNVRRRRVARREKAKRDAWLLRPSRDLTPR